MTLPQYLAEEIANLGIDLSQSDDDLRQMLSAEISDLGGRFVLSTHGHIWVVELVKPINQTFRGQTINEAMAWCRLYLEAPEYGPTDSYS